MTLGSDPSMQSGSCNQPSCRAASIGLTERTYLVHRDAGDPAILLEDLLHISLDYLEGVEVANKDPGMDVRPRPPPRPATCC